MLECPYCKKGKAWPQPIEGIRLWKCDSCDKHWDYPAPDPARVVASAEQIEQEWEHLIEKYRRDLAESYRGFESELAAIRGGYYKDWLNKQ